MPINIGMVSFEICMIDIFVPIKIVPKQRPRLGKLKNGKSIVFTPKETKKCETILGNYVRRYMQENNLFPVDVPLCVNMIFLYADKKKNRANMAYNKRPDLDNLIKTCLDSLNGIAYVDDSRVVSCAATKLYSKDIDGVHINIYPWGN